MAFVVLMVLWMGGCHCVECSVLRRKEVEKMEGWCLYIDFYGMVHVITYFGRPVFGRQGVPIALNPNPRPP